MALEHFRRIADATDLPLIVFQIRSGGQGYPMSTLERICDEVMTDDPGRDVLDRRVRAGERVVRRRRRFEVPRRRARRPVGRRRRGRDRDAGAREPLLRPGRACTAARRPLRARRRRRARRARRARVAPPARRGRPRRPRGEPHRRGVPALGGRASSTARWRCRGTSSPASTSCGRCSTPTARPRTSRSCGGSCGRSRRATPPAATGAASSPQPSASGSAGAAYGGGLDIAVDLRVDDERRARRGAGAARRPPLPLLHPARPRHAARPRRGARARGLLGARRARLRAGARLRGRIRPLGRDRELRGAGRARARSIRSCSSTCAGRRRQPPVV